MNALVLTERDMLMLIEFLGVLNYFSGFYLLMWLRKDHGDESRNVFIYEIFMHVYLHVVYILEIFNVLNNNLFVFALFITFTVITLAYHVRIYRNFKGKCFSEVHEVNKTLVPDGRCNLPIPIVIWMMYIFVVIICYTIAAVWFGYKNTLQTQVVCILSTPSYFNLVLKVSFLTVAMEAYCYIGYKLNGFKTLPHDKSLLIPIRKDVANMRFVTSVTLFMGILILITYPDILTFALNTNIISRNIIAMTATILMQIAFILDVSSYFLGRNLRRLIFISMKRGRVGLTDNDILKQNPL